MENRRKIGEISPKIAVLSYRAFFVSFSLSLSLTHTLSPISFLHYRSQSTNLPSGPTNHFVYWCCPLFCPIIHQASICMFMHLQYGCVHCTHHTHTFRHQGQTSMCTVSPFDKYSWKLMKICWRVVLGKIWMFWTSRSSPLPSIVGINLGSWVSLDGTLSPPSTSSPPQASITNFKASPPRDIGYLSVRSNLFSQHIYDSNLFSKNLIYPHAEKPSTFDIWAPETERKEKEEGWERDREREKSERREKDKDKRLRKLVSQLGYTSFFFKAKQQGANLKL